MTVEIISWSISTKVWYRVGIELATPGSAVRHASVARHVTDACLTAEPIRCDKAYTGDNPHLMHQSFVSTAPLMHQSFVSTAPSPTAPLSTWISVFFHSSYSGYRFRSRLRLWADWEDSNTNTSLHGWLFFVLPAHGMTPATISLLIYMRNV